VYRDVMFETKKSIQLLTFYHNGSGAGVQGCDVRDQKVYPTLTVLP
jgi:hypothetical protein